MTSDDRPASPRGCASQTRDASGIPPRLVGTSLVELAQRRCRAHTWVRWKFANDRLAVGPR